MTLWMVRAGSSGEREEYALDQGYAVIGWDEMPDMAPLDSKEAMTDAYRSIHPNAKPGKVANAVGQLRAFAHHIQQGDLIAIPLKTSAAVAIGTVAGPYEYDAQGPSGAKHRRKVTWIRTDIPRASIDQDLLYSLGAFLTVCQISRHNAEERIRALIEGRTPITPRRPKAAVEAETEEEDEPEDSVEVIDLERAAKDRIVARIQQRLCGHDLSRLVNAILVADGYITKLSPPGADGGVDILAGSGPMGFSSPRIAVQVKSGDSPSDVVVLRGLQGSMQSFQADHGLLVSWAGFKPTVFKEAAQHHFRIRLWDADEILANLLRVYERLDEDLRADLPLKRIWLLADEEEL
jgi:restriction system protein